MEPEAQDALLAHPHLVDGVPGFRGRPRPDPNLDAARAGCGARQRRLSRYNSRSLPWVRKHVVLGEMRMPEHSVVFYRMVDFATVIKETVSEIELVDAIRSSAVVAFITTSANRGGKAASHFSHVFPDLVRAIDVPTYEFDIAMLGKGENRYGISAASRLPQVVLFKAGEEIGRRIFNEREVKQDRFIEKTSTWANAAFKA